MGRFTAMYIDLMAGRTPPPAQAPLSHPPMPAPGQAAGPAAPLDLDTSDMAKFFRRALLDNPNRFSIDVRMPKQDTRIELDWKGAGQTVGVALWVNPDHVAAASILLNGVELEEDLAAMHGVLASRGFALPYKLRETIAQEPNRPLNVTLFYSRRAMRLRPLTTVIPVFATAYFALFGTDTDAVRK